MDMGSVDIYADGEKVVLFVVVVKRSHVIRVIMIMDIISIYPYSWEAKHRKGS